MISQNCPRCGSRRIRHGYRPTPIWLKVFFRYHLLCDNCNWEFTGFAVPGTVSVKPARKSKKHHSSATRSRSVVTEENGSSLTRENEKAQVLAFPGTEIDKAIDQKIAETVQDAEPNTNGEVQKRKDRFRSSRSAEKNPPRERKNPETRKRSAKPKLKLLKTPSRMKKVETGLKRK
jgi:hypothetical protein